ncbi:RsmD family RNA methyltransferase [Corynebacterium choanae]|uniref:RsmD family RNA methyltransferase n=1 Tax=Corynebacterium choanae TaxID=1862358 RepID=UPI000F4FCEB2|nr:RsmD family RNA methyltransferase [Corynebacterium choanae]
MTRIIAGEARGRKIRVPEHGTRPTSDRAREGLCSSLNVRWGFGGAQVLDLYAGSGAVGLEAASRGAASVVLVEHQSQAVATIRHNATVVGHRDVTIVEANVTTYLATAPANYFDMVFADPPYDMAPEKVNEVVAALVPALQDDAIVVVERHRDSPEVSWPAGFTPTGQKLKKRTFGIARMDMAIFDRDSITPAEAESAATTN